jgi:hypothetical protein
MAIIETDDCSLLLTEKKPNVLFLTGGDWL